MFQIASRLVPRYASALALVLLVALAACGQNAGTDGSVTAGTASPRAATAPPVVGGQPGVVINLEATATPEPTAAAAPTPLLAATPYPTGTPYPTATPYPTPTPAPQPTYTPVPMPTPYPTATPYPTPTPAPQPTYTPMPTPTPRPTATPYPTPTPAPQPTHAGAHANSQANGHALPDSNARAATDLHADAHADSQADGHAGSAHTYTSANGRAAAHSQAAPRAAAGHPEGRTGDGRLDAILLSGRLDAGRTPEGERCLAVLRSDDMGGDGFSSFVRVPQQLPY